MLSRLSTAYLDLSMIKFNNFFFVCKLNAETCVLGFLLSLSPSTSHSGPG